MTIKIQFGVDSLNRDYTTSPTTGQVITDPTVKAVLGYGDSVRALVNGVEVSTSHVLSNNDQLRLETKCNEKAV